MQCPKCKHENKSGRKFCSRCGTPLENVCPKCGYKNDPDDEFCGECGAKLADNMTPNQSAIPKLEDMHAQLQSLIPEALAQKYLSAIDMREAMKDYQLQVSIGINTAMMTVGEIQTQLHSEYTAYGTDINLAKRLQESAEPNQILVGSGTHRLTRRAFDFDIIPSLTVKGFSQPVTAYSVKQAKTHPEKLRGIEGLRARMIGREHEFTDIKESVDEWLSGHGQIVSVIGEAGIGKSRMVSELKAYLSSNNDGSDKGFKYLEGMCVSIGQPISYWPFIDIL